MNHKLDRQCKNKQTKVRDDMDTASVAKITLPIILDETNQEWSTKH